MRIQPSMALARGLAVLSVGLSAACAQPTPPQPLTHVDRVIEDVTAMIEGMMQAHAGPSGLAQIPDYRSLTPRS